MKTELEQNQYGELILEDMPSVIFERTFVPNFQSALLRAYGSGVHSYLYHTMKANTMLNIRQIADSIVGTLGRLNAKFLSQELLKEFPKRGYGTPELVSYDKSSSSFVVKIFNCFNCKGVENKDYICAISAGLLAGGAFAVTHKEMDALQLMCCARGDPYCEFKIAPSASPQFRNAGD